MLVAKPAKENTAQGACQKGPAKHGQCGQQGRVLIAGVKKQHAQRHSQDAVQLKVVILDHGAQTRCAGGTPRRYGGLVLWGLFLAHVSSILIRIMRLFCLVWLNKLYG